MTHRMEIATHDGKWEIMGTWSAAKKPTCSAEGLIRNGNAPNDTRMVRGCSAARLAFDSNSSVGAIRGRGSWCTLLTVHIGDILVVAKRRGDRTSPRGTHPSHTYTSFKGKSRTVNRKPHYNTVCVCVERLCRVPRRLVDVVRVEEYSLFPLWIDARYTPSH